MSSLSHDTSLCLDHPLADGFRLDKGKVSFKVPQVKPNSNYIVIRAFHIPHLSLLRRSLLALRAVMGDSGNASPQFTIKKC